MSQQTFIAKLRRNLKQKASVCLAVYYAKRGRFKRAVKLFEVSEVDRRNTIYSLNSHYLYALSLFRTNKNLPLARKLIEPQLASSANSNTKSKLLFAEICLSLGDAKESERVLLMLKKEGLQDSYKVRFLLGMAYHNQGKWVFAKEEFESIREEGANNPVLIRALALSQFCTSQYRDASISYRDAAMLFSVRGMDKEVVYCAYRSAWSAEIASEEDESVDDIDVQGMYDMAVRSDTVHNSTTYGLGVLHELYGRRDEALKAYSETIESRAYTTHLVLLKRAGMFKDIGDRDGAQRDIDESLSIRPTMEAYEMQGALRFDGGDYAGAEQSFASAISRSDNPKRSLIDWYIRSLNKNGRSSEVDRIQKILNLVDYEGEGRMSTPQYYTLFSKYEPVDEKTIVYESFHGKSFGENLSVLCRYLSKHSDYSDYTHVAILNDEDKMPIDLRGNPNIITVRRNSIIYAYYLSTAKYLINNTTFPDYFNRRDEQRYLNTWHGVAWKTLGRDMKAGLSEMSNSQRNLLQSTHIIAPNPHMENVLLDRYCIRSIYSGRIAHIGYPRIDETISTGSEEKLTIRRELGFSEDEKIVLYAPTWRGTNKGVKLLSGGEILKDIKLIERQTGARVVYRGHHIDSAGRGLGELSEYEVPESVSSNILLSIADLLITDYSSIAFDMIAAKKPVVWYLPDYDEYSLERGLYFSKDKLPGTVASNREELSQAVKDDLSRFDADKYRVFANTYCPYDDGSSTERVVDFFFNDDETHCVDHRDQSRSNVLMFAGNFLVNGITTSSISLLNSIDKSRYNVFLLCNMQAIESDPERLAQMDKLDKDINIIARSPGLVGLLRDEVGVVRRRKELLQLSAHELEMYEGVYQREYRRVVSGAPIDSIVNMDGYLEYEAYLLGINKGASLRVPSSIYLHNDIYSEYKTKYRFLARIFQSYPYYDRLVSVSEGTSDLNKANLAEKIGIERSKFIHIDNVHDAGGLQERANEPVEDKDLAIFSGDGKVFLTIGRLSPEKDHEKLIRAFSKLEPDSAKLIIVGYGPLESRLKALVRDLGASNVYILGLRSNPMPLLKRADCFVLSSNYEGQPVVLFEAMALNKPIIATDIIANRGALEGGRYGVLCNNSADSLAEAMQGYINSPDSYEREIFDVDKYNKRAMNRFYREIIR